MRLIDADVLIDIVKNKYSDIIVGGYPYNVVAHDMVRIIDDQPTAYDLDEVLQRLEDALLPVVVGRRDGKTLRYGFSLGIAAAVKILKEGFGNETD